MHKRFSGILLGVMVMVSMSSIASASSGLTIGLAGGLGRTPIVSPGESYIQTVIVTAGDADRDIAIEVMDYRQDPEDGVVPLDNPADIVTFSARQFITPSKAAVHVSAGESKKVDLSVSIPDAPGDGGRYALLRFSTGSRGRGSVGVVSAIVLPFKFTIKNSNLIHTGKITGISMAKLENGEPLEASITYENTGNHHYTIAGELRVVSADGSIVGTFPIKTASPIPGSASRIPITWTPDSDVEPGLYSIEATLTLEDGTLLDRSSSTFEVSNTYVPPSPTPSPAEVNNTEGVAAQPSGTNWIPMIALAAGAFILGSAGTMLASKRRRVRR